jgi:predicted HTH domain antitoxin
MSILIPDEILTASEMSEAELKLEIAIMLYKRQKLSAGKAAEWLGLNLIEFRQALGQRGVTVNYEVADLEADRLTLQNLGRL